MEKENLGNMEGLFRDLFTHQLTDDDSTFSEI